MCEILNVVGEGRVDRAQPHHTGSMGTNQFAGGVFPILALLAIHQYCMQKTQEDTSVSREADEAVPEEEGDTPERGGVYSSGCVLRALIILVIGWQDYIQRMQEDMAKTLQLAAKQDMKIYQEADKVLSDMMDSDEFPKDETGDDAATKLQKWQAKYNQKSQSWQNKETQWNSVIQSLDQNVQTMGSNSQQASQTAAVIIQDVNIVTRLLQAPLA